MAGKSQRPVVKQIQKKSAEAAKKRLTDPLNSGKPGQQAGAKLRTSGVKLNGTLGTDNTIPKIRKRINQSLVSKGKKPIATYRGKNNG